MEYFRTPSSWLPSLTPTPHLVVKHFFFYLNKPIAQGLMPVKEYEEPMKNGKDGKHFGTRFLKIDL